MGIGLRQRRCTEDPKGSESEHLAQLGSGPRCCKSRPVPAC